MRTKYISRYIYKIIKLILFALMLTYFCACAWYMLARLNWGNYNITFLDHPNVAPKKGVSRLIVCCYFALTTLATVGYGDIVPQNNGEKIMGVILMIVGIAFFSYIMSNFNDVLINYDKKMGIVDQGSDLQVWLTSLSKFTSQKPLPRDLVKKIDQHFRFYWKNDRLSGITKEDDFLKLLPKDIRHDLIMYLFDEVFQMFRGFFLKKEFESNKEFFYDIAFYLLPRKAEAGETIMEQGDDANEIYFILDGEIKLFFESEKGEVCRFFGKDYYFGDYYVFFEKPSEFTYKATTPVNMLVLPKSKMMELAAKHKNIYDKMLSNSIKNSMYTAKAMQNSLAALFEKSGKVSGEVTKMPHDQLIAKYTYLVKEAAKNKRLEKIKKKNQEIMQSEEALGSPTKQGNNLQLNAKNFKQNLEDLDIIAKKIDRLKNKLEQSLS